MHKDHNGDEYQHSCRLPESASAQDALRNRSRLVEIINRSFCSTPLKIKFYSSLKKQERETMLCGSEEGYEVY